MRWWRRKNREADLERELRSHLESEAAELQQNGLSAKEARYAARRTLGNTTLVKEDVREMWGWSSWDRLRQDARYGIRMLRKNPGFTTVAVLSLALGIGANTAIFSIIDAVLLHPLPFPEPERLVSIQETESAFHLKLSDAIPVSALHFVTWRKQCRSFEQIALLDAFNLNLTGVGEPQRLEAERVSASFFPLLGVQPRIGRSFLDEEDQLGHDHVVILSHSLWRSRFQSEPKIIGRKIMLDGVSFEVVGVMPATFHPPLAEADVWKPFAMEKDELQVIGEFNYNCLARLKKGVSRDQALAEMRVVQNQIARTIPERMELGTVITPIQERITAHARQGLVLLLAAVGAVLLMVCLNIANLLLARATVRRRELSIRAAIGASSGRLCRQMLTESLIISGLGGTAGLLLANAVLKMILAHAPAEIPRLDEVRIDTSLLPFAFLISVFTGIVFGFLPAWRLSRAEPQDVLKTDATTTTASRTSGSLRRLLVGAEVGVTTVCLALGGLLLHSFVHLLRVDRGFNVDRVLTVNLMMPDARYPEPAARAAFLRRLLDGLQSLPGVISTSACNRHLLSGEGSNYFVTMDGDKAPLLDRPLVDYRCISPGYFRTFGIPLIQGRVFNESDTRQRVAVLSAKTARLLWPRENPLGKHFRLGDEESPVTEVVGVAGDVRGVDLDKVPNPTVYLPYWQRDRSDVVIAARTAMEPASLASAMRAEIRKLDPELPVPAFETMEQVLNAAVAPRRFQLILVSLFAATALLLASIGIYGVVSYSVAQRRAEIGIRVALGATASDVRGLILRQGMAPVLSGWIAGLIAAMAAGRIVRSLLFDTSAADELTLGGVSVLVLLVAMAACYLPGRRATRIDPIQALRYQ
jgi:predicted permease